MSVAVRDSTFWFGTEYSMSQAGMLFKYNDRTFERHLFCMRLKVCNVHSLSNIYTCVVRVYSSSIAAIKRQMACVEIICGPVNLTSGKSNLPCEMPFSDLSRRSVWSCPMTRSCADMSEVVSQSTARPTTVKIYGTSWTFTYVRLRRARSRISSQVISLHSIVTSCTTWKRLRHYLPLVKGIHWWPVAPSK